MDFITTFVGKESSRRALILGTLFFESQNIRAFPILPTQIQAAFIFLWEVSKIDGNGQGGVAWGESQDLRFRATESES